MSGEGNENNFHQRGRPKGGEEEEEEEESDSQAVPVNSESDIDSQDQGRRNLRSCISGLRS